jgi:hypothetical protein
MSLAPLMKSKDCRNPSQMLPICAQTGREGRPTPARECARAKGTPPSGWARGSQSEPRKARVCRLLAHPGTLCKSLQDTHGASREQRGARIPRTGGRRVRRPPWDLFEGVELHASAPVSSPQPLSTESRIQRFVSEGRSKPDSSLEYRKSRGVVTFVTKLFACVG